MSSDCPHRREGFRILKKERLTPATNRFVLEAPWVARAARPGQFVIVRVHERGERIPVTISDFDPAAGTITVVVQEVGHTSRLFGELLEGQQVLDLVGPLGEPFRPRGGKIVLGVGGGFGAAALYPVVRSLHEAGAGGGAATRLGAEAGAHVEVIVGARSRELLILEAELESVCRRVMPCTDDGSYGFRGLVTDRLKIRLEEERVSLQDVEVVAVGPMPMMRAVAALTAGAQVPTQISLDPIMIDGTGMCGGCRVSVGGEVKFACVDGPFFDAHQVDFAECIRRNKRYAREEAEARPAPLPGDQPDTARVIGDARTDKQRCGARAV